MSPFSLDWLCVGKSFTKGNSEENAKIKQNFTDLSESTLQVYIHHDKWNKEKKRHKKRKIFSTNLATSTSREIAKDTKSKRKKRRGSSFGKYDADDLDLHSSIRSRRRQYRSRSNPFSRDRSCSQKEERPTVEPSANEVVGLGEQSIKTVDKLYHFDRIGNGDNRFFGPSYVSDPPLYDLATGQNVSTGDRISQARAHCATTDTCTKENLNHDACRYFSDQARNMELSGRQKRLYLAHSEKRLARAAAKNKESQLVQTGCAGANRLPDMAYIPLDPLLTTNGRGFSGQSDGTDEIMLTDGQSFEQHLVECSKMLNANLATNPHDVNKWLDLLAFQEQTIRLQNRTKGTISTNSTMKTSVMEKQAAILAKALANNPKSRELHRVKLNMSLQSKTSSDADVELSHQQQLESFIAEDPSNCEVWLKLLQSRQQHFSSFSMQSVRDLYARIITVLRAESASAVALTTAPTLLSSHQNTHHTGQAEDLSVALLEFHFLMCQFEKSAGYVERSVAHIQALIDFNLNEVAMIANSKSKDTHLTMLQKFAERQEDKSTLKLGDEHNEMTGSDIEEIIKAFSSPSLAGFQDHIDKTCIVNTAYVNPPTVLQTDEHKLSLMSAFAPFKRQSHANSGASTEKSIHRNHELDFSPNASDDSKAESGGVRFIYSNLHGYRIETNDTDDSREYERILNNLRGSTEHGRARQIHLQEKEKKKRAVLAATISQGEDQRANYDPIDKNDRFIHWLCREKVQRQLQWAPLHSSNHLHKDLIEQQPDRVTLTEEILPFLFSVPVAYQWRLVAEILQICGVKWQGEFTWETSLLEFKSLYADGSEDYELLVGSIVAFLSPQGGAKNHLLFLDPSDRKSLLETALLKDVAVTQDVLSDPDKVAFVRRIFAQALNNFSTMDEYDKSALKCLWIGFELIVTQSIGATEKSVADVRLLSQILAEKTPNGSPDLDVLYSYAKLEFGLKNKRQARRICENALKSLGGYTLESRRHFHRFVFLHARLELWSSINDRDKSQLCVLQCLYILKDGWQPSQLNDKEEKSLKMIAKKYKNRTGAYLQELLMSNPSTRIDLMAQYRADLDLAVRQCANSTSQNSKHAKVNNRRPHRSKCWARYCLHNFALVVYAYDGFDAAYNEYRQFLSNSKHQTCAHELWAWTCFLDFMQQHHAAGLSPILSPRLWRSSIYKAVETFPHNELFLRLFADSESGNTVSQVLRNYFLRIEKRWRRHHDSPELVEWLFALLCEFYRLKRGAMIMELSSVRDLNSDRVSNPTCCVFHRWGMNATAVARIRQMFESMVNQIRTKGSALCWELYMRFEVALGKVDAATKVLYRGVAACAWSKSLFMTGLCILRPYLSEEDCLELIKFMEAKELSVRADLPTLAKAVGNA